MVDYTSISNDRAGYGVSIAFIGLFFLIFIINGAIQITKNMTLEYEYTFFVNGAKVNGKLLLIVMMILVTGVVLISFLLQLHNAFKFDIQNKIGQRFIKACGGTEYYQRESSDELLASMIYDPTAENPLKVAGSPIKQYVTALDMANYTWLIMTTLFMLLALVALYKITTAIGIQRLLAANPSAAVTVYKWWKDPRVVVEVVVILGYIAGYAAYFIAEMAKRKKELAAINTADPNAVAAAENTSNQMYIGALVRIILLAMIMWAVRRYSKLPTPDTTFEIIFNTILPKMILLLFLLFGSIIFFKSYFAKLLAVVYTDYMTICNNLNTAIQGYVGVASVQTMLYNSIRQLEPSTSDDVGTAISKRINVLYQYLKHRNGTELGEVGDDIATDDLTRIRSLMKQLRGFTGIQEVFGKYMKKTFLYGGAVAVMVFYTIFHASYKENATQMTTVSIIGIIFLLLVACVFGWISNTMILH